VNVINLYNFSKSTYHYETPFINLLNQQTLWVTTNNKMVITINIIFFITPIAHENRWIKWKWNNGFYQLFNQLTIIAKQWWEAWIISTLHKLKLKTNKIKSMGMLSKNILKIEQQENSQGKSKHVWTSFLTPTHLCAMFSYIWEKKIPPLNFDLISSGEEWLLKTIN
jgi:hypothetical protein